jgi:threonine/homoserine/homoserine lactone efflux protein
MFLQLFVTGIVVGFLVAMPVGPIGILIIQRTANKSRLSGLVSGLGSALADLVYAIVAGYSLTFIIELVRQYQLEFQILGSLAVVAIGVHIFLKNPAHDFKKFRRQGNTPVQDLTSAFVLTLANPIAIFAFLALFASSGATFNMERPYQTIFMVAGVFTGAFAWWFVLTEMVNCFKHRFNLHVLWWFNKIAGASVLFFVFITLVVAYFSGFKI